MFSNPDADPIAGRDDAWQRLDRPLRRLLPRSLMGRSMLIVLIPLLVTQAIALGLFYGTYLNVVSRRLSDGVTGEISLVMAMIEHEPLASRRSVVLQDASSRTQLGFTFHPGETLSRQGTNHVLGPVDDDFARSIQQSLGRAYDVDWSESPQTVRASIQLSDGVMVVMVPIKRLNIGPIWLFVVWAVSSSILLFLIAGLFMRNQVRAIRRLGHAAELFGMGRDQGAIRPQGAREVRQAAVAFNRMQARVNRFVAQRTAVLAGVSHDLRTPLTRLRLTVAMIPTTGLIRAENLAPDLADMVADIEDMERLIGSYLSFARGEGAEEPVPIDLRGMLDDVAVATVRAGGRVLGVEGREGVEAIVRPDALRRVLTNLAENARRHGGAMRFSLREGERSIEITIEDDGPGLPADRRAAISELRETAPGTDGKGGLGLTIVRDIIHAHGGSIRLMESPLGGLRVLLELPK
ncbi:ATP-binding protein [Gluconobacter kanchanaburiensis]|uniref:histidine kinase n=1 Tax=Gluconobacter kanchanaburiensis NBRC 103587 TaxID=1307948 RepID=A0A511BA84_9PROT|nr:ATP-binding protein [Gluconobacter kanchanaburiensis]MBF0861113.1 HAMP domain-containing protein [Gluconobacter kanchanaburiensis]GBR70704.1 two component sensor histidine kinase EnvZ [Gluconobacter kanchanaburiensis NBRC 103587]GEK97320.1 ATPase [Gluconobacter kanchanaburiensis NBRC 103587]